MDDVLSLVLSGRYVRPDLPLEQATPFVHDAGLTLCRQSRLLLSEVQGKPSDLEVLGDAAVRHLLSKSGSFWSALSLDASVEKDAASQHQEMADRERVRSRMSVSPTDAGRDLEVYASLRRRVKW
jgi:hypothetical protein